MIPFRITYRWNGPGGSGQELVLKAGSPSGFELAETDGHFVPATVELREGTITLVGPAVPNPASVRYAWSDNPVATLFNISGLPAAPFQRDEKQ